MKHPQCKNESRKDKSILPNPKDLQTIETIATNGRLSVLKKEDKTFCISNDYTGDENGHFLTKKDAVDTLRDMSSETTK